MELPEHLQSKCLALALQHQLFGFRNWRLGSCGVLRVSFRFAVQLGGEIYDETA